MSCYRVEAKNPKTKKFEPALMLDDYYGRHKYGVKFGDGEVYPAEKIEIVNN